MEIVKIFTEKSISSAGRVTTAAAAGIINYHTTPVTATQRLLQMTDIFLIQGPALYYEGGVL
jgi:hypothetical protein